MYNIVHSFLVNVLELLALSIKLETTCKRRECVCGVKSRVEKVDLDKKEKNR